MVYRLNVVKVIPRGRLGRRAACRMVDHGQLAPFKWTPVGGTGERTCSSTIPPTLRRLRQPGLAAGTQSSLGLVVFRADLQGAVHLPVRMLGVFAHFARDIEIKVVKLVRDLRASTR